MCKQNEQIKDKRILGKFKQFFATICLGPISMGSSLVWTSPVLPQLLKNITTTNSTPILQEVFESDNTTNTTAITNSTSILQDFFGSNNNNTTSSFQLTIEEGSWVGAMLAIGSLSAAIPAGYLADRFGSKKCILGFVVPVIIFTFFAIFAEDVYTLCIGRLFSGIATGGVSVVAPMYISEIADVSLRGTLGSFFELLIYLGIVITAVFGAFVHYITLTTVMGIFALFVGVLFIFFPESPTYLMKTGKREKAEKALKFYRSKNYDVTQVLDEISDGLSKRSQQKTNIGEVLKSKAVIRGLVACVGLTSFQQMSGIDGITFYTVFIFQEAGASVDAYASSIIIAVVELLSAGVVVLIVEKIDRKIFLYISSCGTCICLALFGLYFTLKESGVTGIGTLPLTSMICYNIFFALGLGPIPWMINGELFSPEIKGLANGITIATNWILLFIITKTLPMMLTGWGAHYTFYTYSIFMFLCTIFVRFCVPETRGKTLVQIQEELKV